MMRPPRGCCFFFISRTRPGCTKAPVRLVSTTAFQVATGSSSSSTGGAPMPALLNSTSRRPNVSSIRANSAAHRGLVADVGRLRQRPPALGLDLARHRLQRLGPAPRQHHVVAGLRQPERHRAPHPRPGPSHQGDLLRAHRASLLPHSSRPPFRRPVRPCRHTRADVSPTGPPPRRPPSGHRDGNAGTARRPVASASHPLWKRQPRVGASPSGKAAVFGTAIPRFESWRPSHFLLLSENSNT